MAKIPSSRFPKKSAKIPSRKLAKSKTTVRSTTVAQRSAKTRSPADAATDESATPAIPPNQPLNEETRQDRLTALKRQSKSLISASDLEPPSAESASDDMKSSDALSEDARSTITTNRIQIIPAIHGKMTYDGKVCEPDMYWIVEKWLQRHPEVAGRANDIRVTRGTWTTGDGLPTEVIHATIINGDDIAGYEPSQDTDLYEYWLAEDRYHEAG
jgi:hypothetical protein